MDARDRSTMLRVRRRCLVCEHESTFDEVEQTFEIGTPCPECHAPTERIEVLQRRSTARDRNANAAALGRLGGLKGGPARAVALSADRRREIALKAARARWSHRRSAFYDPSLDD